MSKDNKCINCNTFCNSIFNELESSSLMNTEFAKVPNTFKKGQNLFLQGNPSFGLFCIKSGVVKVTQTNHEGKETIVRLCKAGDVIGHRSLFTNQIYQCTATSLDSTQVCFFDSNYINKLIKSDAKAALNIINNLAKGLGLAERRISSFSQKSVRERLAELLLILAEGYGVKNADKIDLKINLKREEMASIIGTATETLIRFLSELKKEGIIQLENKVISILNKDKLLDCANIDY